MALGRLLPLHHLFDVDESISWPVLCTSVTHSENITSSLSLSGPVLEVEGSQESRGSQLNPERPLSWPVLGIREGLLEYDASVVALELRGERVCQYQEHCAQTQRGVKVGMGDTGQGTGREFPG